MLNEYLSKVFLSFSNLIKRFLTYTFRFLTHYKKDTNNGKESSVRTEIDEEKCKNRIQATKKGLKLSNLFFLNGDPPETRTPDPLIKSQLLYQLS